MLPFGQLIFINFYAVNLHNFKHIITNPCIIPDEIKRKIQNNNNKINLTHVKCHRTVYDI